MTILLSVIFVLLTSPGLLSESFSGRGGQSMTDGPYPQPYVSPVRRYSENQETPGDIILSLKTFPSDCSLYLSEKVLEPFNVREADSGGECGIYREFRINSRSPVITLTADGYRPEVIRLEPVNSGSGTVSHSMEIKLEPFGARSRFLGYAETGEQPKSVECFTSEMAVTALLRGRGIEIFHPRTGETVKKINIPEPYGSRLGFVESVYLPGRNEIWISQMDTEKVHIINSITLKYEASVPAGGKWTKILTASPDEKRVYASNWLSENLGVINTETRMLEKVIPLSGIPRGSAFAPAGDYLYVCIYETGNIEKIHIPSGRSVGIIQSGPGAARHILYDENRNLFYISDMWHGTVYTLNPETDRVENRIRVGPNLNTIKLTEDGRYLFVSSRGKNNPRTYLIKGAEFGTISVLDTSSFEIVERIYGGNQPTGLALSEDGRTLIFSDFLDRRLEYYDIESYQQEN